MVHAKILVTGVGNFNEKKVKNVNVNSHLTALNSYS